MNQLNNYENFDQGLNPGQSPEALAETYVGVVRGAVGLVDLFYQPPALTGQAYENV